MSTRLEGVSVWIVATVTPVPVATWTAARAAASAGWRVQPYGEHPVDADGAALHVSWTNPRAIRVDEPVDVVHTGDAVIVELDLNTRTKAPRSPLVFAVRCDGLLVERVALEAPSELLSQLNR